MLLLLVGYACTIPGLPQPSPEASPTAAPPDETLPVESTGGLPGNILTEVAGSIYATLTQQAIEPDVPKPTQTAEASLEPTTGPSNNTPIAQVSPTDTLAPDMAPTTDGDATVATPISPNINMWITDYYRVRNVNLHDCGLNYAANFKITSTTHLDSLSLKLTDQTTSAVLYGPTTNNAPFLYTDRTCNSTGADSMGSLYTRYVGGLLGPKSLSTHTIIANIKLCTLENLSGFCADAIIEFVVP